MKIANRIDTDHQPLTVLLKRQDIEPKIEAIWKVIEDWSEENKEKFKKETEKIQLRQTVETNIEVRLEELIKKLKTILPKIKVRVGKKSGRNKWWDKECRMKKKETRNWLKDWKKKRITEEEYKRKVKEYKILCQMKRNEQEKKEKKEIEDIKNETELWKFINRETKMQKSVPLNKINIETWINHFKELYGGTEKRIHTIDNRIEHNKVNIQEITETEIDRQITKLKNKKSPGEDNIRNEVWKNSSETIKIEIKEIFNKIWRGGGFPERWRQGTICPIFKKGNKEDVKNYRGITLMDTLYKIYASILEERLKEDIECKGLLPDSQAGFRKGRSTVDNIFILKHIIDTEIKKEGGKLYAMFADFKSAFDMVDREQLWEIMTKKGVDAHLINKIKEIYEETTNTVKIGDELSNKFWTVRGLRQGCPLSPILFALYLSDLDETLAKWQAGGIVIGGIKIWSLSYADDIVMIAKSASELRQMLIRFEKYLDKKKMILSTEKTKIVEFRKGGGREKKEKWAWKESELDQVKEMKYLGYVFQKNNKDGRHIRERVKKTRSVMGQIWSIGERKFKTSFKRRMFLFDTLIKSVLLYGVEIWGWKEIEQVEQMQERYIRWSLGLDKQTPSYIILEETKRDKLRIETGKRALKFEQVARNRNNRILQACIAERDKNLQTDWWRERKKYCERNGYSWQEKKRKEEQGEDVIRLLTDRDKDIQKQEQQNRIDNSRYNTKYNNIKTISHPRYLTTDNKHQKIIARFRCGNEENINKFWLGETEILCRMCGQEQENIEHLRECREMEEETKHRQQLLDDNGSGVEWMKKVKKRREQLDNG